MGDTVKNKFVFNDGSKMINLQQVNNYGVKPEREAETWKPDVEDAEAVEVLEDNNTPADCISKCFNFPSEFTKQQVGTIIKTFYGGEHANLALIEVALFDHGQLKKRNSHTAFVKTLVAWGYIKADEETQKQIISGIKDKYKRLPVEGYKEWGNLFLNDKNRCVEIGKKLDPSMKYIR